MKKVSVFYPHKNISPFDYGFTGKIDKRNYDENGEFLGREPIEPSIEHYEKVSETKFIGRSNEELFNWVVTSHNVGSYPEKITEKIRNGELNVGFSSFSAGCVVRLDSDNVTDKGSYYISTGMGFELLPLEFSNDQ